VRYLRLTALLLAGPMSLGTAEHNPLLPRPQRTAYGNGHLWVRDLKICFGSAASLEDRSSAAELSCQLRGHIGREVPIWESCGAGRAMDSRPSAGSELALRVCDFFEFPRGPRLKKKDLRV
jgi:hypothetical protein